MSAVQAFIRLKNPLSGGDNFLNGPPWRVSAGRYSNMGQETGKP